MNRAETEKIIVEAITNTTESTASCENRELTADEKKRLLLMKGYEEEDTYDIATDSGNAALAKRMSELTNMNVNYVVHPDGSKRTILIKRIENPSDSALTDAILNVADRINEMRAKV